MKIKKGDKVIVIAGKEKGKSSTVIKTIRETNRVVLEGLNMMKKHIKSKKEGEKGSIVSIPMSMDASNVKLADKKTKKVAKVKTEKVEKKTPAKKTVKKVFKKD
jgi:large subunit ribosomal protein L24